MAKRHGGEKRGSAAARRARKHRMLNDNVRFDGDGTTVGCVHCRTRLTFDTLEADRIVPGGSYRYENVQPACRPCNLDRSNKDDWTFETSKLAIA